MFGKLNIHLPTKPIRYIWVENTLHVQISLVYITWYTTLHHPGVQLELSKQNYSPIHTKNSIVQIIIYIILLTYSYYLVNPLRYSASKSKVNNYKNRGKSKIKPTVL